MQEAAEFVIKQGDTAPRLVGELIDGDGNAVNVHGAAVALHLHGLTVENDTSKTAVVLAGDPSSTVYYDWAAGDTDDAGYYAGEWQVTYSNGQIETFPNGGVFLLQVEEQLA